MCLVCPIIRGSDSLPRGIIAKNSNLEMWPLWGLPKKRKSSQSLLAMAVGIKQTKLVNAMVGKFLSNRISVMLFHYDGNVNQWKEFWGNDRVVHVSAINQTKWWCKAIHAPRCSLILYSGFIPCRRIYKDDECDDDSKGPPCTGWMEVMAPVFSRPAWRCVWYMIQVFVL
ncbi:Methionine--tRNA ligase [Bienertia sinuspersici]